MIQPYAVGDLVLSGGHLTSIQRVGKLQRATGAWYPVRNDFDEWSQHLGFRQDWTIRHAVLGETVCRHPHGTHSCGLTHLPADELAQLVAATVKGA